MEDRMFFLKLVQFLASVLEKSGEQRSPMIEQLHREAQRRLDAILREDAAA